jgi:hypothetical protein
MNKEFIPYEQALALEELGFNEPCFATYSNVQEAGIEKGSLSYYEGLFLPVSSKMFCLAPTYQQAFRWFREKYNLHAEPYTTDMGAIEYCFQIRDLYSEKYIYDNFVGGGSSYCGTFNTPEEAELACLIKLIEINQRSQSATTK